MTREALLRLIVPGTDPSVIAAYAALAERARDAVFGMEDELAIVDIETTGFDPARDRIIELACAIVRGPEVLERFSTLVDPGGPIPAETTKLTGIDRSMLEGAPHPDVAVARLAEAVNGRDVVAHNVGFDKAFLERVAGRSAFSGAWLDSLQLSRISLPRLNSHRLRDLADAFGADVPSHRAPDDVSALAFLWRVMLCGLDELDAAVVRRIAVLAPETDWSLRRVIAHHAAGRKSSALDLKRVRREATGQTQHGALDDADELACVCPSSERVVGELSAEGVAGRMYDGYEERAEQTRMAAAVIEAFASRTHLAVEAGTGVGKSVAYLVPAAFFALENNVGVGVATKTNTLTDQLVHHELPKLDAALGGGLRAVSLKGYEHYLCLRKFERFLGDLSEVDADLVPAAAALLAWVTQSTWGDLDGVNLHWRRDLRAAVQATQADCTRKRCRFFPHQCYLHGVRRRAASAHVVVTNHALLFRDVIAGGGILPPLRHWIVDEAHSAEPEARKQLTIGAAHAELTAVLGALHGPRGGTLDALSRQLRSETDAAPALELIERMKATALRALTLADSLFDFVKDLGAAAPDSGYDDTEIRLTPQLRDSGAWGTVSGVGRSLAKRLRSLVDDGRELITRLESVSGDLLDTRADVVGLLARVAEQHFGLVTVLDGEADEYVYSVSLDRRRTVTTEKLRAAPVDVGAVLAEEFYPRTHTVIFTSATIATGDDFSHFAHGVGLDRLEKDAWRALRLPSSYDFDAQMAVFVPTDISEPNTRGYLGELEVLLEQVHRAMGGSVLTLFTNRREMDALYEVLEPRLEAAGISLLLQGRGVSAKRLRDEFLADERLSLFATKSFWEGFDAKGDTLRCVVVPRLPFGVLGDPLYQERQERDPKAWQHYYLPEAVIELKQAAGRLIRSRSDTGCLVIADSRVAGRRSYGREFLEALPVRDVELMRAVEVVDSIGRRFGR